MQSFVSSQVRIVKNEKFRMFRMPKFNGILKFLDYTMNI